MPTYIEIANIKMVAEQGWLEAKKPLRSFFENDGKRFEKSFFNTVREPYIQKSQKKDISQLQKAHLTRPDVYYALAYAKYLEHIGKTKTSLVIYKAILTDVKEYATKDLNTLSLITRFVVGNIVRQSLYESLQHNIYSKEEKKDLYSFLKSNLLLDTNDFPPILEAERNVMYGLCKEKVVSNVSIGKLIHAMVPENNATLNKAVNTISDYLSDKTYSKEDEKNICNKMDKKNRMYYRELNAIATENDAKNFEIKFKHGEEEYIDNIQYVNTQKDILTKEHDFLIDLIADTFVYVSFAKWPEIKLDLIDSVSKNKKIIESLK
ncbi:hypothetical protein LOH54_04950 [Sulfurimonas sp. HSL-3221]|uniref:hypothetical protein n=1 Tax=Thiomicrolovo sulfuroxydans TaxID=2894755 RepID=UPI001E34ECFE|nr:hypothetical protein [Sulfurimonas sp. HSL-3221]UFS63480.1 hypothetical protein LOH54_04950 [Sulfurimonas sp. HSL-3221]